jgi:Bacterial Ig-like domain (group 3)/ell wall binding domain 2 (CWB2)
MTRRGVIGRLSAAMMVIASLLAIATGGVSAGSAVPTTTTLVSSPNPSTVGTPVLLTATVTSSAGTITGTITIKDGTTAIASGLVLNSSGVVTTTISSLAVGTHPLTAVYDATSDPVHAGSTSPVDSQVVNGPANGGATHFAVTAPASTKAGVAFDLTVTALDGNGVTATMYSGTVQFTSSDTRATLPADYTFVTADNGTHRFAGGATLRTGGPQTVTATDKTTATLRGTATIEVTLEPVVRLAGEDRILTAIAISKDAFPAAGSASAAVLARADAFPDALAGTPLAVAKHGPLLLSSSTTLDPRTQDELQRALPTGRTVYLLGGIQALGDGVKDALATAGYNVVRYGGADRYATAVTIADQGLSNPATILEATGQNFADALAGGAAAAHVAGAILLTNGSSQAAPTATYLAAHSADRRYALGGPAAAADPKATALVGADRYETSVKVAQQFFTHPTLVGAAFGGKFPDGLAGGAHIGQKQAPLVLVNTSDLPSTVRAYLSGEADSITKGYVYGGALVVGDSVLQAVQQAITGV